LRARHASPPETEVPVPLPSHGVRRTAVVPWGEGEAGVPPQKIRKGPLSAQLGIDENIVGGTQRKDVELNSENSSALGETGAQDQGRESPVTRSLGSEAATPAPAADAASGEGSAAAGARDEGQAKAEIAQRAEPSVKAEKNFFAGKIGRDRETGDSPVVSFDGAAADPLR
jgi:hypothetical protein